MVDRPTFHESWYRVAKLRPRLRTTVHTWRQHFRGRRWHVVQDPTNNQHFRLDDNGYHFVGLLDGKRTVDEAWTICNEHLGDHAPTQGEVVTMLGQLYTSNLLQSDLPADAAGMLEHHRQRLHRQVRGFFTNALFARIPVFDPDRLLTRVERVVGPLLGPIGLVIWILVALVAVLTLSRRMDELVGGLPSVLAPGNLPLLYISFAVVKALHELGHGLATKRIGRRTGSGGEVHTFGITLLVFTPVPYVDASSAWSFRSKWHRAFVGAAGMYVELFVAAIAAIVWASTSSGLVHSLAWNTMFVASVSTLLFNGNPLLRFDAYYILSDLLEIPNLGSRSRSHLSYLVRRYIWGVRRAFSPALGTGERFWLPVYAVTSLLYRVVVMVGIILFVSEKFFIIGVALAIVALITWTVTPIGKLIRYLTLDPELARVHGRAYLTTSAAAAAIAVVVGLVPVPDHGRAEGVVEPIDVAVVYAEVDGFVDAVLTAGGLVTPDGHPLLESHNRALETNRQRLVAERQMTKLEQDQAGIREIAVAQSLGEQVAALDERIAEIDDRLASLAVRAPIAGRWIAPDIDRMRGGFVKRGDAIGVVASVERLLVRAVADQRLGPRLGPEIGPGGRVEIRVAGRPEVHLFGTLREVLPAGSRRLPSAALGYSAGGAVEIDQDDESGTKTAEPFFEALVDIDDATAAALHSGQRVVVRFEMAARPLAVQWWRALGQLFQRRFQT
jgi:putative peptide zinc metalloprotease protein